MTSFSGRFAGEPDSFPPRILAHLGAWLALAVRRPSARFPWWEVSPGTTGFLLICSAGIASCAAAMMFVDAWALEQQRLLPPWVVALSGQISYYGKSGWVLWPLAGAFVAAAGLARPGIGNFANGVCLSIAVRLEFLFFAIAIPGLADSGIKRLIGRARPSAAGPFDFVPFSASNAHASLPSGHATSAAAIAIAFGTLFPKARIPLWFYAGVVALSRIGVRAHYPSDVIAGLLFGVIGAILIRNWFAARRLALIIKPVGTVLPMPGCSLRRVRRLAGALLSR